MKKLLATVAVVVLFILPARAGDIFRDEIPQSQLNITTATVVKAAPGMLVSFAVTVPGSAAGTINDTTTTGGASAANTMCATPTSTGAAAPIYFPMQFKNGLVVVPGSGQTITVSYQ